MMQKQFLAGSLALFCTLAPAGTIYLCKAYNGATFYASDLCSNHKAFIERIESVADVPFAQQVEQVQQTQRSSGGTHQAQQQATDHNVRCGQLIAERRQIESRYTNWQWQPPEVINPDQQRTRGLNAELASRGCSIQ